ncbi:MAG: hypothetical protein KDC71_07800, partial [Acidobacteria bacterium]|nr:hypothetical protein [Acidobacteriota bacterium]
FWVKHSRTLVVELAHIDGGGEGVLLAIQRIAKDICAKKNLEEMECLVYAVSCARPNMKLRAHLVKRGFEIKNVPHKGEVFYKVFDVSGT